MADVTSEDCRENGQGKYRDLFDYFSTKKFRGTAEANVFLASTSAIILLTAFELKFQRCYVHTCVHVILAMKNRL